VLSKQKSKREIPLFDLERDQRQLAQRRGADTINHCGAAHQANKHTLLIRVNSLLINVYYSTMPLKMKNLLYLI